MLSSIVFWRRKERHKAADVRHALLETIALRILDWLRWSRPETFTGTGCDVLPGYYVVNRHGTHFIVAFESLTEPERDAIGVLVSKKAQWAAEKAEAFGKAVGSHPWIAWTFSLLAVGSASRTELPARQTAVCFMFKPWSELWVFWIVSSAAMTAPNW